MSNKHPNTITKQEEFTRIYIQEYLRDKRSQKILEAIAGQFITSKTTVMNLIRPATLQRQISENVHQLDPDYKSIM